MNKTKPSEQIIARGKEMAMEDYKKENPYAGGWEYIEDMSLIKFATSYEGYMLKALLEYLDSLESS